MDNSRNLPTCKLENQKEPEFQLTVAKKLYMVQVQGRFFSSSFKFRLIKICILQGDWIQTSGKGKKKSTTPKYFFTWLWTLIVSFLLSWGYEATSWWDDRGAWRGLENDLEGSLTSSAAIIVGKEPEDAKQQEITRRVCQHNQLLFSLFFGKFIRSREHLGWPGAQVWLIARGEESSFVFDGVSSIRSSKHVVSLFPSLRRKWQDSETQNKWVHFQEVVS